MYDELVKRLRDSAKMSEALAVLLPHSEGNATAKLYKEAADAIEELQKPKTGTWRRIKTSKRSYMFVCNSCNAMFPYLFLKCCPACGVMFVGEKPPKEE